MMEVRQMLNSVLFQGMKENEIEGLLKFLKAAKKTYQKGETIFHMGECVTKMGIIVKGSVYIIRVMRGEMKTFWTMRAAVRSLGRLTPVPEESR